MKAKISLLVVLLLVVTGCSPNSNPTAEASITTADATVAINSGSTTTNGITTYVDKRTGIAFDYPSGWSILVPPDDGAAIYTYSIAPYDLNDPNAKHEDSLEPAQTEIDITFYGAGETIDSARTTLQSDVQSGMAVIKEQSTRTAVDGSIAYYYAIQGRVGGAAQALYTSVNGHTVSVVAYGDGANFEAVAKSLRKA